VRQFTKPYQVLFVMDPLERANAFYATNPSAITPSDRVTEVGGYFIYYEKNVNMHEYMLSSNAVDYAKPPTFVEFTPVDNTQDEPAYEEVHHGDDFEEKAYTTAPRITNPEEVIRRHQEGSSRRRGARVEQRRASSMLAGLCAVLFVVSFVMGVGLIRNQDRIERMEMEIRQLTTAHRNLFAQMSSPEFAPAFAEANPPAVQNYGQNYGIDITEALPPIDPPSVPTYVPAPTPPPAPQPPAEPPPELPPALTYTEQEALIPPVPLTYTIQPGDSLIAISIRFFGDAGMVEEILVLNGIENPDMIVAGSTITLPQR